MSGNIYRAWDACAAQAPDGAPRDVRAFLAEYLRRASQRTKLPLDAARAGLLAELADTYVDGRAQGQTLVIRSE